MSVNLEPAERYNIVVYEEEFPNSIEVSEQDIIEYSQRLGIDLQANPGLSTLVRDWILQPLPRYWYPCLDTRAGIWFYSNALNGQSIWEHPLEEIHRRLAREYCDAQNSQGDAQLGTERENPEGESAEASMEFNSKESISLSPLHLGSLPLPQKNQLPRALAPIKRLPKIEPLSGSTKPILSPIVPSQGPQELRATNEISFSTFKPPEPSVPSLLPTDQLYDKTPLRPISASLSTRSVPAILTPLSVRKPNDATEKEETGGTLAVGKIPSIKADAGQLSAQASSLKPPAGLSFTERLAAKKASRVKGSELDSSSRPSSSLEQVVDAVTNDAKKHVQFDLENEQIRQYTPEYSEDASKAADKSESSSSEDFMDFVGDPGTLKSLSDLTDLPVAFEEKRWDVSFSSFGVTSTPNESPVKKKLPDIKTPAEPAIHDDEMITCFNSEFCPSPLPAKTVEEPQGTCNPSTETLKTPLPIEVKYVNQLDETEGALTSKMTSKEVPAVSAPIVAPCEVNGVQLEGSSQQINSSARSGKEIDSIVKLDSSEVSKGGKEAPLPRRSVPRPNSLTRSFARSDSVEEAAAPFPITAEAKPSSDAKEPSNHQSAKSVLRWNIDPAANPSPPASPNITNQKIVIEVPPPTEKSIKNPSISVHPAGRETSVPCGVRSERDERHREEEWLLMKRQLEMTLEDEKAKLEGWFSREIAQIKTRFESELASERQRTEDLRRLVEIAKEDKEKMVKENVRRLEEKLAKLVDEKSRELPPVHRLDANIQTPLTPCQDANIQTEPPPPPPSIPSPRRLSGSGPNVPRAVWASASESQASSPQSRQEPHMKCQCDVLQRQVARVEKEMQLLKQKNISFQKSPSANRTSRKKSSPVKAKRESWWIDSDIESSTESTVSSSYSDWRPSSFRGRSKSLTNLYANRETGNGVQSSKKFTPVQRARGLLYKNQVHRRSWMDDLPTDRSTDTATSGISSAVSTGDWDTVLNSIQKISGDLREVWSHIGSRPQSAASFHPSHLTTSGWMLSTAAPSYYNSSRVPLHWPLNASGSTVERTQALRLWLQRNNPQISQPLLGNYASETRIQ